MRSCLIIVALLSLTVFAASCTVATASSVGDAKPVQLVADGKPLAAIVVADKPDKILITTGRKRKKTFKQFTNLYAAQELRKYIEKATGAKLPILKASQAPAEGALILVGRSALTEKLGVSGANLKSEGFRIATRDNCVAIVGEIAPEDHLQAGHDRGTLWGVYEFLEQFVGVRWYFGGELGTVIPKRKSLVVPSTELTKAPYYAKRWGSIGEAYSGPDRLDWYPVFRQGDTTGFAANHTCALWGRLYGKSHPEYFGLDKNGKRMFDLKKITGRTNHLCYTEPGVLKQDVQNIIDYDADPKSPKTHRWGSGGLRPTKEYVRFSPNDCMNIQYCRCERCAALLRQDDWRAKHSELVFGYADKFAREIGKRWPGRRLGCLAYVSYERVPRTVKLADNLDVMQCLIRGPQIMKDPRVWKEQMAKIDEWVEHLGNDRNRFFIWTYMVYPNSFSKAPMLTPKTWAKFHRAMKGRMKGEFNNGFRISRNGDAARITLLDCWVFHRTLWDPDWDVEGALAEFYSLMFGPAEAPMKTFFNTLINRWEDFQWSEAPPKGYVRPKLVYGESYTPAVIKVLKGALAEGVRVTSEGSIYRRRIDYYAKIHKSFFDEAAAYHKTHKIIKKHSCRGAPNGPKVDGVLDDPAWKETQTLLLTTMKDGLEVQSPTWFKVIRVGDVLYIGARMTEKTPRKLAAKGKGRDARAIAKDDRFGILVDGALKGRLDVPTVFEISINPKGVVWDGRTFIPLDYDSFHHSGRFPEWSPPGLKGAAKIGSAGWTAELAIPLKAFPKYEGKTPPSMRVQFFRSKRTAPREMQAWNAHLAPTYEIPLDRFGVLTLK